MSARATLDAAMTEAEFQEQVEQYAEWHGWAIYHTRNAQGSDPGYPDLCCVRVRGGEGRLVYLELKTERGRVTADQAAWIDLLGQVPGVIAMIVRPSDWPSIERVLT